MTTAGTIPIPTSYGPATPTQTSNTPASLRTTPMASMRAPQFIRLKTLRSERAQFSATIATAILQSLGPTMGRSLHTTGNCLWLVKVRGANTLHLHAAQNAVHIAARIAIATTHLTVVRPISYLRTFSFRAAWDRTKTETRRMTLISASQSCCPAQPLHGSNPARLCLFSGIWNCADWISTGTMYDCTTSACK